MWRLSLPFRVRAASALLFGIAFTVVSNATNAARSGETNAGLKQVVPIDAYGDPLPPGAIARMGTLRDEVGCVTSRIIYSPDGRFLTSATTCETNPLRLWDPASGRVIRELKQLDRSGRSWPVAFSPDGKLIAAADGADTIRVGKTDTGEKIREFPGHEVMTEGMAFSRDSKVLVVSHGTSLGFWDIATGARTHAPSLAGYSPVELQPFGAMLAMRGSRNSAPHRFAMVPRLGRLSRLEVRDFVSAPVSRNGKSAAVSQRIRYPRFHIPVDQIWDCLDHHVEMSADGRLLAVPDTLESLCLWDVATGRLFRRFHHFEVEWGFTFAPDGKRVVSGGTSFHHWDIARGHEIHRYPKLGEVRAVAFGIDGKSLVTVHCPWEESTARRRLRESTPQRAMSFAIGAAPDRAAQAATEEDATLRVWDVGTGREIRRIAGLRGLVEVVALSPDGKVFAASNHQDRGVRFWDVATGREIRPCPGIEKRPIHLFSFAPDGKTLVVTDDDGVSLWDMGTGKESTSVRDPSMIFVALAPGGNTLAYSDVDDRLCLRDLTTDNIRRLGKEPKPGTELPHILCLAFTPDGKTLASGGADKVVTLWDTATGRERQRFDGHISAVSAIAFTTDGKRMASGSNDGTALVWDLKSVRRD
jgi:WD40 repeat protein